MAGRRPIQCRLNSLLADKLRFNDTSAAGLVEISQDDAVLRIILVSIICYPPHHQFSNSSNSWLISASRGENLPRWLAIPSTLCTSVTDRGASMSTIAHVFSGSALIPLRSIMQPRYLIEIMLNSHFAGFYLTLAFSIERSAASKCWSCSSCIPPSAIKSFICQSTPGTPSKM